MFIYLKGIFLNPGGYISWSNKFGPSILGFNFGPRVSAGGCPQG